MFDIGFSELVVIGLIALIVLGPKRLPEVARTAGKWAAQLRRFVSEVKQDFDREINHEELAELRKLKQELDSTRSVMENTSGELLQGFTEIAPSSTSPTIHSNASSKQKSPASAETSAPSSSPKRASVKRGKKPRSGRKHGGTRRTRR
jgi:sec-independent protein translocase protein TatB